MVLILFLKFNGDNVLKYRYLFHQIASYNLIQQLDCNINIYMCVCVYFRLMKLLIIILHKYIQLILFLMAGDEIYSLQRLSNSLLNLKKNSTKFKKWQPFFEPDCIYMYNIYITLKIKLFNDHHKQVFRMLEEIECVDNPT